MEPEAIEIFKWGSPLLLILRGVSFRLELFSNPSETREVRVAIGYEGRRREKAKRKRARS